MIPLDALNLTAFLLSIILLGYSAYSDLKTREVSNLVWAVYLPLALALLSVRLILDPGLITLLVISIVAMACLSFLMFYLGLFGGADLKGFICLSIALPIYPFSPKLTSINPVFPLTILYTAYFLSLSVVFYVLIKNLSWRRKNKGLFKDFSETTSSKKIMVLLTGYKASFAKLQEKVYLYPMEEISKDNSALHRRLKLFVGAEADRDQLVRNLGEYLSGNEKEEVWVTPGIPLLLFAWIALILNAFAGDVLMWMVFKLASIIL